jgi:hypothetical protein
VDVKRPYAVKTALTFGAAGVGYTAIVISPPAC